MASTEPSPGTVSYGGLGSARSGGSAVVWLRGEQDVSTVAALTGTLARVIAIDEPGGGSPLDPAHSDGTQLGKRYVSADGSLEVLCTKGDDGSLSIGSEPLARKDAKPLPSSD